MQKTKHGYLSRRNLFKIGAGAVGTGILTLGLGTQVVFAEQQPAEGKDDLTPMQALRMLMDGNKRFIEKKRQSPHQDFARITEVAKGQKPFACILSCADSRVPPEIIFDQGFGDLFVCRVAGNLATTEETGSEEYGTLELGAKVLMVLGHERCGAVKASLDGGKLPGQIGSLVEAILPSVKKSAEQSGDRLENAVKANILTQVDKLKASPVIADLVKEKKLLVVGAYYDLDTATVSLVRKERGEEYS
ncbi:MAG: carbonic anhydrase [Potamolinea sp.]